MEHRKKLVGEGADLGALAGRYASLRRAQADKSAQVVKPGVRALPVRKPDPE